MFSLRLGNISQRCVGISRFSNQLFTTNLNELCAFSTHLRCSSATRKGCLCANSAGGNFKIQIKRFSDDGSIVVEDGISQEDNDINATLLKELEKLSSDEKNDLLQTVLAKRSNLASLDDVINEAAINIDNNNINHYLGLIKSHLNERQTSLFYLHKKDSFRTFLFKLRRLYTSMDYEQLITTLICFHKLELEHNNMFLNQLLEVVHFHMNGFSVKNLMFLNFFLKKISTNPLGRKLSAVVPLMLEKYMTPQYLMELTFHNLVVLLGLCISHNLKNTHVLVNEMNERGVQSPKYTLSILWNLFSLPSNPIGKLMVPQDEELALETLTKECLNIVSRNMEEFTSDSLFTTLVKASDAFLSGHHFVYHEFFLREISSKAIRENWSPIRLNGMIFNMLNMRYVNEDLVIEFLKEINQEGITSFEARKIFHVISALSHIDDVPPFIHDALKSILKWEPILEQEAGHQGQPLYKRAVELLSVDYYDSELIEAIFSPDYLKKNFQSRYRFQILDAKQILLVNHRLSITESFSHLCLSPTFKKQIFELVSENPRKKASYNLSDVLQNVLPNADSYLVSDVHYKQELFIDKLLVLNEEGHPVSVELKENADKCDRYVSLDELDIDDSFKRIAFINIIPSWTCNPGRALSGFPRLLIRCLEEAGLTVVPCFETGFVDEEERRVDHLLRSYGLAVS